MDVHISNITIRNYKPYCTVYCTGAIGASGSNAGVNNALPAIFSKDHIIYGVTFEFYLSPFHFKKYHHFKFTKAQYLKKLLIFWLNYQVSYKGRRHSDKQF